MLRSLALLSLAVAACGSGGNPSGDAGLADSTPSACEAPLPEETLSALTTTILGHVALQPGQSRTLELGVVECCYVFQPVDACATWSIEPSSGASVDPVTGRVEIDPDTAHGSVFTVTADVENGRRLITTPVHVYTDEGNPLIGYWREQSQFDCMTGDEVAPEQGIQELAFFADGTINVTWFPFELYVDYWGDYLYDLGLGELSFTVTGGNYVPANIDAQGLFSLAGDGTLVLDDIWLGNPADGTGEARCGHRFSR